MTWMSFAARSGGLLLVTPLTLRNFSPAQTSLWFLFLTISSLIMMADFGFGPSFVRAISYARGGRRTLESGDNLLEGPNQPLLGSIYSALLKSYTRLSLIGGLLGAGLGKWAVIRPPLSPFPVPPMTPPAKSKFLSDRFNRIRLMAPDSFSGLFMVVGVVQGVARPGLRWSVNLPSTFQTCKCVFTTSSVRSLMRPLETTVPRSMAK